ncbi:MAG: aldehyde dehydrogenase [Vicinamibacteria bacterium]|nr:aldehyde dehydrogenase [Vicinamibacteria bacterium]
MVKVLSIAERGGSPFRPEAQVVNGRFTAGEGAPFDVRYPATGETLLTLRESSEADCDHALAVARATFARGDWRLKKGSERAAILEKAAAIAFSRAEDLARMIVFDNGKTLPEARIDVLAAGANLKTFARYAAGESAPSPAPDGSLMKMVVRDPVGVVVGLTPYNAPLPFASLKAGPALAAGNSVVFKPSERSPLLATEFARILYEAGLPEGALSVLHGGAGVASRLAGDDRVDMITMTGGTAAGAAVMRLAAPTIKNLLLELGGKSAHIILEDADLDLAVRGAAAGIFRNSGQRCFSGSRLVVQASVADRVESELCALADSLVLGDPFEGETEVGAMIDERAVAAAVDFVARAREQGLKVGAGGHSVDDLRPGSFFRPTVLLGGTASCGPAREELFGPVTTVIRVQDAEEAIAVANDSKYGLGGGVWSNDLSKALSVARRVRTGMMWVNTYGAISGDIPFGGYGQSGLGREGGAQGYEAYSEPKSIVIETNPGASTPLFRSRKP